MKNLETYHDLNIWVYWLLMTVIAEKMSEQEQQQGNNDTMRFQKFEVKTYIKTHISKNINYND